MPVVYKGGSVFVIVKKDNLYFKAIKMICQQWGTKPQTILMQYSTDYGINYADFEPTITSTNFEILNNELTQDINAIKFSFNANNQVGIKSLYFDLVEKSISTDLPNIEDKTNGYKVFNGTQILIIKNKKTFNVLGQRLD